MARQDILCLFFNLLIHFVGDVLNVSNPEGTFDVNRLQSVTEAVLIAAGSGNYNHTRPEYH